MPRSAARLLRRRATERMLARGFDVKPSEVGPATTEGVDPDRILLIGNGALNGWGVASRDDAVPGHLARELAARTGRPAYVDVVNEPQAVCAGLPALADSRDLLSFDAVVVIIGVSDALRLTPALVWRRDADALLDHLVREAPGIEIVFLGAQRPSSVPILELPAGGPVDRAAAEYNTITPRLCSGRATFLMPPDVPIMGPRLRTVTDPAEIARASEGYREWARVIADQLAAARGTGRAWGR
jgi:hypothetical protein